MMRDDRFAFRLNADDRRLLAVVAASLQRSQSDAIRWLIRRAVREIETADRAGAPRREGEGDERQMG